MLEKKILIELQEFVDLYLTIPAFDVCEAESIITEEKHHNELKDFININRKPSFTQVLLNFIDNKGSSDSDIYKKLALTAVIFRKYVPIRIIVLVKIL